MSKALSLLALVAGFALCIYLAYPEQQFPNEKVDKKVSGAYQALDFFGMSRTYPDTRLPAKAHFDAWARLQKDPSNRTKNFDVAPWEALGPLNISGRTLKMVFNPQNPNTLFAGSASGGLWKSTTGGVGEAAWEYVPTGFPVLGVSAITFNPEDSMTLYIGTGEVYNYEAAGTGAAYRSTRGSYGMGILKSTDGGNSWSMSLDWSYQQNEGIWDIKISQQNPNIVYAATTKGVYKSTDAGQNWSQVLNVLMANSLIIHPDNDELVLAGCGNFQSPGFGIYKSINGGNNWVQLTSGLPPNFSGKIQLEYAPSNPETVYASIGNGFGFSDGASWICKSTDFGNQWNITGTKDYSLWQGWFAHDLAVNPLDENKLAIVGITVWKSNNSGAFLDSLTRGGVGFSNPPIGGPDAPGDQVHSDAHDVIYHPVDTNVWYVANDGGIHRTTNGGQSFQSINGGYQTVQFYNGFSNSWQDSVYSLGGLQDNGTIQWTGTPRWRRVFGGDGSWTAINQSNDQINYISYQNLNMFRSPDRSDNFDYVAPPVDNENTSFIAPFVIAPSNPNVVYAGRGRVYRSENGGVNWSATSTSNFPQVVNPILSLDVSTQSSSVVYAASAPTSLFGGSRGNVYVTQNDGASWTDVTANLPDRFPMDIRVDPTDDATAYIAFSGFGTGHVFKTTDYGQNWNDISGNLPDVPANAIEVDPLFPAHIYVGNDLGVFVSTNAGNSWEPYMEGLFDATMIFDLKISPSNRKLRAATHGNGAFQRSLIETFVNVDDLEAFSLQVYPNPVSNLLNLNFELDSSENIQGEIFDIQGKLVERLFSGQRVPGIHRLIFNLRHLSPGVYNLRLSNGEIANNQKLVIQH
ncbi:MAG: T9SS type A sorting domain-containing protein [Bacteroidia bacterium]|nr:T9SS type A sorting domain-containing protein [Bacteroidia bacterium]